MITCTTAHTHSKMLLTNLLIFLTCSLTYPSHAHLSLTCSPSPLTFPSHTHLPLTCSPSPHMLTFPSHAHLPPHMLTFPSHSPHMLTFPSHAHLPLTCSPSPHMLTFPSHPTCYIAVRVLTSLKRLIPAKYSKVKKPPSIATSPTSHP